MLLDAHYAYAGWNGDGGHLRRCLQAVSARMGGAVGAITRVGYKEHGALEPIQGWEFCTAVMGLIGSPSCTDPFNSADMNPWLPCLDNTLGLRPAFGERSLRF